MGYLEDEKKRMEDEVLQELKDIAERVEQARTCPKCEKVDPDVCERYSFGVYAGRMCEDCAYNGYRDHCGLEGAQGSQADLDEPIEPEPYYGMEADW